MKEKGTKNLTLAQRIQLETLFNKGLHKKLIAEQLNISLSSIYRELQRGSVNGIYSADYAQAKYEQLQIHKRKEEKLNIDKDLAQLIANLILNENLSPEKAMKKLKEQHIDCPSKTTIYYAIRKGLIPNVTLEDLRSKTTTIFSDGKIQLPSWMRKELDLKDGDTVSIAIENESIIIGKIKK